MRIFSSRMQAARVLIAVGVMSLSVIAGLEFSLDVREVPLRDTHAGLARQECPTATSLAQGPTETPPTGAPRATQGAVSPIRISSTGSGGHFAARRDAATHSLQEACPSATGTAPALTETPMPTASTPTPTASAGGANLPGEGGNLGGGDSSGGIGLPGGGGLY